MKTLKHENTKFIEDVIRACDICFVSMADIDGTPYNIPMNFGYHNGVLYLHSAQEGRSISILERNPRVCIAFCSERELLYQNEEVACSYRMRAKSVIAQGKVQFVEDFDDKVDALNVIMRQYSTRDFKYGAPAVRNVKIWKVKLEDVSCKEFGVPYRSLTITQ